RMEVGKVDILAHAVTMTRANTTGAINCSPPIVLCVDRLPLNMLHRCVAIVDDTALIDRGAVAIRLHQRSAIPFGYVVDEMAVGDGDGAVRNENGAPILRCKV